MAECRCGHPENHCAWCDRHFVVTVLARDCEAKHEALRVVA